jgi:outer membrane protein TolC
MSNFNRIGNVIVILLSAVACAYGQRNESTTDIQQAIKAKIEERLVRLAWDNHPSGKIAMHNTEIAQKTLSQDKWAWLDRVKLQGNLNEFTLDPQTFDRSAFFPRYNFSIAMSLGDFAIIPLQVRKRREELAISQLTLENQKLLLKSEVLKKYNHYLSVRSQLNIQRKLESEIGSNLELAKSKFNNNQLDYQSLSTLSEINYNQQLRTIQLEEALREATVDVEMLIGVRLETVLAEN